MSADEEAETVVLGSMMLSGEAVDTALAHISAPDFSRERHQHIFEAVCSLYAEGQPTDAVAVADRLRRESLLEKAGGPLYLHHVLEMVAVPEQAEHFAKIVAHHALLRRIIAACASGIDKAKQVPEDAAAVADEVEAALFAAVHRPGAGNTARIGDIVRGVLDDIENPKPIVARTGLRDIDDTMHLAGGNLVVIAARPAVGKSALAAQIARTVSESAPALVFSLEMTSGEVIERLLSGECGRSVHRLKEPADYRRLTEAVEVLSALPLYVHDAGGATLLDIRSQARRLKARHGLGLVVVDYLQLMSGGKRYDSREQEVAEIARGLKLVAKELDVPVIACAQLNREVERRASGKPLLSDLRESGAIEAHADIVMLLHRPEDGICEAIIAKHRNGPTATIRLAFQPHLAQFRNLVRAA